MRTTKEDRDVLRTFWRDKTSRIPVFNLLDDLDELETKLDQARFHLKGIAVTHRKIDLETSNWKELAETQARLAMEALARLDVAV